MIIKNLVICVAVITTTWVAVRYYKEYKEHKEYKEYK